jgi:DNA-binding transcriptional MerR regulator
MRNVSYFKPKNFPEHVTITELSRLIEIDVAWLRRLERAGRIPKAQRVKRGKLMVRLWSPDQVDEIAEIISHHRPGRPRKNVETD